VTLRIEHIDETVPLTGHVVVLRRILPGVRDKQVAVHECDAAGCISGRYVPVHEAARGMRGFEGCVEHVDGAGVEIRREQE
jgi:hypothetical protein